MAIWYVDLTTGAGLADGTSFANRSSNFAAIVNAAANGDEVRVKETLVSGMGTCTWTNNSTVSLPSGTLKTVYADGAWTAATNVTATASTTRKQGSNSSNLAVSGAFTGGKVASYNLGSAQNFSDYNKITLWFRSSVALAATGVSNFTVTLCSDTAGNTPVDTLTLPAINIPLSTFVPITLDKGSALGSSIQSVAINATADPGTVTLAVDNIVATKNVTLNSLVSKNNGSDGWYGIRSLINDTIEIDNSLGSLPAGTTVTASRGYALETETVTSYYSEGFKSSPAAAATTSVYTFSKTAALNNKVTITGGWDSTNMSTRTGYTHINAQNSLGRITVSGTYLIFEYFITSLFQDSWIVSSDNITLRNLFIAHCIGSGIETSGVSKNSLIINNCRISCCTNAISCLSGMRLMNVSNCYFTNIAGFSIIANGSAPSITSCFAINGLDSGFLSTTGPNLILSNCSAINNLSYGFELSNLGNIKMFNCSALSNSLGGIGNTNSTITALNLYTSGNGTGINDIGAAGSNVFISNWNRIESVAIANLADYEGSVYISVNEFNSPNTHVIYTDGGTITSETGIRYSNSGISWRHRPTSTIRNESYPLTQYLKGVPVKSGIAHNVSVQAYRDNTGISFGLGYQNQGISGLTGQTVLMTGAVSGWEQLSLSLTPSGDMVIDLYTFSYGGTTFNAYWDDFKVETSSKNDVANGDYAYYGNGVYVTSYPTGSASSTETAFSFAY